MNTRPWHFIAYLFGRNPAAHIGDNKNYHVKIELSELQVFCPLAAVFWWFIHG
ncbi:hypothetical protein PSH87_21365 [Pseudomonas sp. FP453]|uniref:hypothetical protein n=1 Tax=Pseudomonas sp. FP453 TaxID=2954094 RepID=UPI0027343103|nr:hypothetical protein [Pseudomonas sp. FP453]WLH89136.1 hypothetical protein PSH87_21365 [Pseudomonas sp. FP453]